MNQMEVLEGNMRAQLTLTTNELQKAQRELDNVLLDQNVVLAVEKQREVDRLQGKCDALKMVIDEIGWLLVPEDGEEHEDIDEAILDIFNESDDDGNDDYVEMQSMADQVDGVKV